MTKQLTFDEWFKSLKVMPSNSYYGIAKAAWDYQQEIIREQALQMISDFGQFQENYERIEALQVKIDSLMLEYCPEDMTPEQIENWKKHQVPAEE